MGNKNYAKQETMASATVLAALGFLVPAMAAVGCGDFVLPPPGDAADTGGGDFGSTGGAGGADTDGGGATSGSNPSGDTGGSGDSGKSGDDGAILGECADEEAWALGFLDNNCAGCHSPGAGPNGNFDYITNLGALLAQGKIVMGDPENSPLLARVEAGQMPPPASPQPGAEAISRLRSWIESCAVATTCTGNEFIDMRSIFAQMTQDINSVPVDDRSFVRYFSLVHLHNAGFCDAEIQPYRDSLFKLVNALSVEPSIVKPVPVGSANLLFRIDLRDYGWDRSTNVDGFGFFSDKWDAITEVMDYSIEFLEDDADVIKLFTETNVPFVMADAFVEEASQPPLYHAMAEVPQTLQQLEILLGVDISDNIAAEEVVRAGVLDSGVSQQNRIVERHEIPVAFGRAMWVSYDFADDSQNQQNIFSSPLDFQEAGGEVIYSLPNGMHAYMLTEANGDRLDVAPDFIVNDPQQKDQNVRNGVSCFSCHQNFLPAVDQVRDYVLSSAEFNVNEKDDVAALYPSASEFAELIDQDTAAFHNSLKAAGVRADYEQEPILFTFLNFDQNVNLKRAAAEVGLSEEALLSQLGRLDPALQQLANTSVKRSVWQSLFAETICRLNLGLADDNDCSNNNDNDGGTDSQ